MEKILICGWPLDAEFGPSCSDPELAAAIQDYCVDVLEPQQVEIFQREGNKVATEKGYYGAFWESSLEKIEKLP